MCSTYAIQSILKPHNDESEDSSDYNEFDAFVEELDSNWYDLIAYDWTFLLVV